MSQYRSPAGPTCAEDVVRHANQPRKRDESEIVEEAVPRLFQREMLQMALKENVVFHAPTGSGKTHVATMLICYFLSQPEAPEAAHKIITFLVPTVALVQQQAAYIRRHTTATVAQYRGDMGVDYWDRRRWQREFSGADVVVLTPQILLNCLKHSYWKMDEISVIVFDEAHHAVKAHPYAILMLEHYHQIQDKENRPRVLGLTASPVISSSNPRKLIRDLEARLDARVMGVRTEEGSHDLALVSRRPIERVVTFEADERPTAILVPADGTNGAATELPEQTYEHDANLEAPLFVKRYDREHRTPFEAMIMDDPHLFPLVKPKILQQIEETRTALGTLGADIYLREWIAGRIARARTPHAYGGSQLNISHVQLHRLEAMLARLDALLECSVAGGSNVSQKYRKLVEVIIQHHEQDEREDKPFVAICFVTRRAQTITVATLLGLTPEVQSFVRAAPLVGHGGADDGMEPKRQENIVAQLRTGELNVLVATSVAEEGLDFPECLLVVRFDPAPTLQSYIQSRGRARAIGSELVYLVEKDSPDEATAERFIHEEAILHKILTDRADIVLNDPDEDDWTLTVNGPRYSIDSTGATLTYSNATTLLSMVCALLPHDEFTPHPAPSYETQQIGGVGGTWFSTTLSLPPITGMTDAERTIEGAAMQSKRLAKASVAFQACQKLHGIGHLDDHLLPHRTASIRYNIDAEENIITFERQTREPEPHDQINDLGPMLDPDAPWWLHAVTLTRSGGKDVSTALGLITAAKLEIDEPIKLHGDQADDPVWTVTLGPPVFLDWSDAERRRQEPRLADFTRYAVRVALNSKWRDGPLLEYFAPLQPDGVSIDWKRVAMPHSAVPCERDAPDGLLVVLPCLRATDTRVATLDGFQGATLTDKIEPIKTSVGIMRAHQSTVGFDTYEKNFSAKRMNESLTTDNEIVALKPVVEEKNRLVAPNRPLPETYIRQRRAMPIGLCRESYLTIGFWDQVATMPSWLRVVEDRVKAKVTARALNLPPIPIDLLILATTLPQCQSGYDYETLETLGDSFLKAATTIHLYTKYPEKSEGYMTYARHNSISNRFLRNTAKKIHLADHTIARPLRLHGWTSSTVKPEDLASDASMVTYHFAPHSLADQMESILGAAWISGGVQRAMECGDALHMLFGGTGPWSERLPPPPPPTRAGPHLRAIEEKIGYTFNDGRLLATAMTHRSAASAALSGERLEWLGDAIVDTYVTRRFFAKHPKVGPGMLTRARSCLVANGMLGWLAVVRLELHKHIVHDAPLLYEAIEAAVTEAHETPITHLDRHSWLLEMPKPLADSFEALTGALFIDLRGDMDRVYEVLDGIFGPLIDVMEDNIIPDPPSRLRIAWATVNCAALLVDVKERLDTDPVECVITVHEHELARYVHKGAINVARARTSQMALDAIDEQGGIETVAAALCTCTREDRATDAWLDSMRDFKEEWRALDEQELAAIAAAADDSPPPPPEVVELEMEQLEWDVGSDADSEEDEVLLVTPADFTGDQSAWLAKGEQQPLVNDLAALSVTG